MDIKRKDIKNWMPGYYIPPVKRGKKKQPEWHEQLVFCKYLRIKYPEIDYFSDLSSASKHTKYMQSIVTILKSRSGWPDTKIFEPIGTHCGLAIEIKRPVITQADSIYKLDGTFKASDHVENQCAMHARLRKRGWVVEFASGATEAINILDKYLRGEYK